MTGFLNRPALLAADDGGWELDHPLHYVSKAEETITIPKGFWTDLASIPRVAQLAIEVNGPHRPAAILHDYLYSVKDRSRSEADSLFLEAMELSGVGWFTRWAMYSAVRVGGWVAWGKD